MKKKKKKRTYSKSAISFVLGDLFSNIRAEDRQSLLHGEVSSQTASVYAYVEIYFDNTDKQFPVSFFLDEKVRVVYLSVNTIDRLRKMKSCLEDKSVERRMNTSLTKSMSRK